MPTHVVHTTSLDVPHEPLPAEQVRDGAPTTGAVPVPALDGLDVGVWEHTPGVSTDVEADEVFVVLSGRASVAVEGGPTLELAPGDLCVLEAGARTTWTVHETLRKVYVSPSA